MKAKRTIGRSSPAYVRDVPADAMAYADEIEQIIAKLTDLRTRAWGCDGDSTEWAEGGEFIDRARGALLRALVGERARIAERDHAIKMMDRVEGSIGGGLGDAVREALCELAWVDDNKGYSPGDFHLIDGHAWEEIGAAPSKAIAAKVLRRPRSKAGAR